MLLPLFLLHEIWKGTQKMWVIILSLSAHRGEMGRVTTAPCLGWILWVSPQRLLSANPSCSARILTDTRHMCFLSLDCHQQVAKLAPGTLLRVHKAAIPRGEET